MELERRLSKVKRYHLALFVLPILSLIFYGWWNADTLEERPDNPLRLSPMSLRGDILDREGRPLAHSQEEERVYPLREAAGSLIGYHLRGRNQSGLEASLQSALSPPAPPKSLWGALSMDRQRRQGRALLKGPSIALTLDSSMQEELYRKFAPRAGVVIVADLRNGEILAAVSEPSFDPSTIGRDFQELRNDPRSPLVERAGSGLYPVRSAAGTPLLTPAQRTGHPWFADNPFSLYPGASAAVEIEGEALYSPLMLLQVAAQQPDRTEVLVPQLLASGVTLDGESLPHRLATTNLPSALAPPEKAGDWKLFTLPGPKFRDSPGFLVLLGRRDHPATLRAPGTAQRERGPLVFVSVVEAAGKSEQAGLRRDLMSVLERY